jgi:hypothetical protein
MDAYERNRRNLYRRLLNLFAEETAVIHKCYTCRHGKNAGSCTVTAGLYANTVSITCKTEKSQVQCFNYQFWEPKEETMGQDRLEAFLGDFVSAQKGGVEAIHMCRKCGTPNLSINVRTGLWQCWCGCGSGKADPSQLYYWEVSSGCAVLKPKEGVDSLEMAQVARAVQAAVNGVDDIRSTIDHLYRLRHLVYDGPGPETPVTPADVFMFKNQLCMALRNREGVVCGWQSYDFNTKSYRIHGERGIVQLSRAQTGRVILTEGFWDAISMQRIQPGESVVCSCGATLSDEQLSILVKLGKIHGGGIVIAFDNDRFSLAAQAHALLSPYVPTSVQVPPHVINGGLVCKDWDDVYAKCGLLRARSVFRG